MAYVTYFDQALAELLILEFNVGAGHLDAVAVPIEVQSAPEGLSEIQSGDRSHSLDAIRIQTEDTRISRS